MVKTMHTSALQFGSAFFDVYLKGAKDLAVVDIGALDVTGSMKVTVPPGNRYIGVDFAEGKGVDVVLTDPYSLPFEADSIDVCICSSCFEHAEFFWLSFNEMQRILKPGGLLFLNVPSNGNFHRFPVDCWRFYADAGTALENWARRSGYKTVLLESFTGRQGDNIWNDFIAVFVKDEQYAALYPRRMKDTIPDHMNGLSYEQPAGWGGDETWEARAKRDFTNYRKRQEDQEFSTACRKLWNRIRRKLTGQTPLG